MHKDSRTIRSLHPAFSMPMNKMPRIWNYRLARPSEPTNRFAPLEFKASSKRLILLSNRECLILATNHYLTINLTNAKLVQFKCKILREDTKVHNKRGHHRIMRTAQSSRSITRSTTTSATTTRTSRWTTRATSSHSRSTGTTP